MSYLMQMPQFQSEQSEPFLASNAGGVGGGAGMSSPNVAQRELMEPIQAYDVNVHTDSSKPAEVGAAAYTQGTDVYIGPGYNTPEIRRHEFGHVVQQMEGRVQPTGSINGMPLNDSPALESEADAIGRTLNV